MAEIEVRRQRGIRRLTELRAGHYKFICFVHSFCGIGMVILAIVTLTRTEETYTVGPYAWSFILASILLVLAVTDVIVVTKGQGTVRNERGFISRLVIFQAILAVLSVPFYLIGYLFALEYKELRLLIIAGILYYIGFVSSMFVTCNCCYATCGYGTYKSHDTEQGVVGVSANEELSAPPPYTQYPCGEPPPSYTPYPRVGQSLGESPEVDAISTSCDTGFRVDFRNLPEHKKQTVTDQRNM